MAVSSTKLHHVRSGSNSGSKIVFLHGFCEDLTMWDEVLSKGFQDFECIAIDLPGFGASPAQAQGSIDQMAYAVIALLDELGIQEFKIFGHSMGGYVALSIAEKFPKRLTGFGLINSHPFADSEQAKSERQKSVDFINKHGSSLYIKQLIPNLFPSSFAKSNRFLIEQLTFKANQFPDRGISNGQTAMINRKDQTQTLQNLSIPFLCLIGKSDSLLPVDKLIQQADFAPVTQIELIKNLGHMGPFENPKIVRQSILNYLSTLKAMS